ncbi:MAG: hypothetical protein LBD85_04035 [Oscillospiraceae bacterium]|jgi:hypothetical protein|nr:hypothetical protein [Oscillospiraceae bacterium]
MLQLLHEVIYFSLAAILLLSGAISKIMDALSLGEHPYLSTIIGSVIGWGVIWLSPTSIVPAAIVAGITTVVSNLVLTNVISPRVNDALDNLVEKHGDAVDEKLNAHYAKIDNREYQKILNSPDANERVKFLERHMRNKSYCYTLSAEPKAVYEKVLESIDSSDIKNAYPEISVKQTESPDKYVIQFIVPRATVVFLLTRPSAASSIQLGLGKYDHDNLKLRERLAFEDKIAVMLDKIRVLVSGVVEKLDDGYEVTIR